jgi:hypothetical protein
MMDIVDFTPKGMQTYDTQTPRAANILSVQLGALEYAQDIGIDLRYFLNANIKFQNDSFKAYLVQVLAGNGINVASVIEVLRPLSSEYDFNLSPQESTSSGLIAR